LSTQALQIVMTAAAFIHQQPGSSTSFARKQSVTLKQFRDQILEALKAENQYIHYQVVCVAVNWKVDAAWSHIAGLITAEETDKDLLLATIEAELDNRNILFDWICPSQRWKTPEIIIC
jgi:DNA-binding SARP family transcriptional activator